MQWQSYTRRSTPLVNTKTLTEQEAILGSTLFASSIPLELMPTTDLSMRELLKSLLDWFYTCNINLKLGLMHDWEHLVFLFNAIFFYAEAKFNLAELGQTCQYLKEDLDVYVK